MENDGRKDAQLEMFLRNVDEVESIIKSLASNDASAAEKADKFLECHQQNAQGADAGTSVDR